MSNLSVHIVCIQIYLVGLYFKNKIHIWYVGGNKIEVILMSSLMCPCEVRTSSMISEKETTRNPQQKRKEGKQKKTHPIQLAIYSGFGETYDPKNGHLTNTLRPSES